MVTVQISLPDELAEAASAFDMLRPQAIEALLRAELRRRANDFFLEMDKKIAELGDEPMTPEEVEDEMQRVKAAQHAVRA